MCKYRQIIDIAENTFRVRYMDKKRKKGFTLTELIVVLVIIAIIAAVAVPFFINYLEESGVQEERGECEDGISGGRIQAYLLQILGAMGSISKGNKTGGQRRQQ